MGKNRDISSHVADSAINESIEEERVGVPGGGRGVGGKMQCAQMAELNELAAGVGAWWTHNLGVYSPRGRSYFYSSAHERYS